MAQELPLDEVLPGALDAARESVRRTPDLLPVLKENGVVDAGAYGLAILAEGLLAAYEGREVEHVDVQASWEAIARGAR